MREKIRALPGLDPRIFVSLDNHSATESLDALLYHCIFSCLYILYVIYTSYTSYVISK